MSYNDCPQWPQSNVDQADMTVRRPRAMLPLLRQSKRSPHERDRSGRADAEETARADNGGRSPRSAERAARDRACVPREPLQLHLEPSEGRPAPPRSRAFLCAGPQGRDPVVPRTARALRLPLATASVGLDRHALSAKRASNHRGPRHDRGPAPAPTYTGQRKAREQLSGKRSVGSDRRPRSGHRPRREVGRSVCDRESAPGRGCQDHASSLTSCPGRAARPVDGRAFFCFASRSRLS